MNNGVLINLNRANTIEGLGYGQFNGDLVNGDLVGTITLTSGGGFLFPDPSVARFTRP
jgi:hypothetical protein